MAKITLTIKQLLGFVIHGLKNNRVDAVLSLVEEFYEQLPDDDIGKGTSSDPGVTNAT